MSACKSSYSYLRANELPLDQVCPEGATPTSELLMEDRCGVKLTRMTGEAACRAGNGLGCATASMLSLSSVGLSQAISQETLASDNDHAYELAQQGCRFGNEQSCLLQAQILLQSESQHDQARGFQLMDYKCRGGMGAICHTMGVIFEEHATAPREKQETFSYYERSCRAEHPDGCFKLGQMWETGFGTSTNLSEAKKHYNNACDLNHLEACGQVNREPPKDDEEALSEWAEITNQAFVDMALAGCRNGFKHGCTFAGRLIERGEIRGRYVGDKQALALFEAGCDQGAPDSCYHLARKVHRGQGIEANTMTAAKLADKACQAGMSDACMLHRDLKYRLFQPKAAREQAQICENPKAKKRAYACYLAGKAFGYDVNFDADKERALELHLAGCELDYADSCEAAAALIEADKELPARAYELYDKACEGGADVACHVLGTRHVEGSGVDKDVEKASSYLERACTRGLGDACGELGALYAGGEGVDKDESRAEKLYRKGCANGDLPSCTHLAQFYLGTGTDESVRQSIHLYRFSCANDEPMACNDLGAIFSRFESEESHIQATEYFEKACMMEYGAGCSNFASRYFWGNGAKEDRDKAVQLYERACDLGYQYGCFRLAGLLLEGEDVEADAERSVSLYEDACEADHIGSCRTLANMRLEGRHLAYDPIEAQALFVKACDLGSDGGCVDASNMLTYDVHIERSFEEAVGYLEKGCAADGPSSCSKLADRVRLGIGTSADAKKAKSHAERTIELNRKSCEDGDYSRCATLAHKIAHGRGTDTDYSGAREFLRKKCDEKVLAACREIADQKATGEIFPRDRDEGIKSLLEMCSDQEDTSSCYLAAYYLRFGKSDEIKLTRSVDLYQDLCDEENPAACHFVGTAYLHGLGVDQDRTRAVNTLAMACTDDDSTGCLSYLEALLIRGDTDKAKSLYEPSKAACEANSASGCIRQAELLTHSGAVARDLDKAVELFERACKIGDTSGCVRAEAIRAHKRALKRVNAKALSTRCQKQNDASACIVLGLAAEYGIGVEDSVEEASSHYEAACSTDDRLGCQLRVVLDQHHKKPLTGDAVYEYAQKACDLGSANYCYARGRELASHDWDAGIGMISRACKEGNKKACLWLTANGEPAGE